MPFKIDPPKITETADIRKRLTDLYSYIFALTGYLNWALNSLETSKTSSGEKEAMGNFPDVVNECGRQAVDSFNGAWRYRKRRGGTYEVWGMFSAMPSLAYNYDNGTACSQEIQIPLPFAVADAVVVGSADNNACVVSGNVTTDSDGTQYACFRLQRPSAFGSVKYNIGLYITGTLNQGGQNG